MDRLIAVIGGDARYLELIRQLQKLPNTTIALIGFDKIEQGFTGLTQSDFQDLEVEKLDAVILPITGTDGDGNVEIVFSDQSIKLTKKWFQRLKKTTPVFTGIDRKSTRLNSSHVAISYAVFCLKKKNKK